MRIEPIDLVGINGVVSRTWVPNLRRKIRSTSENENSGVSFQKMLEKELSKYDSDDVLITNLNEEYSKFNYNFKSISKSKENYDLVINHNSKNTDSFIKNNIVNVEDGKTTIQVSSYVDNGNIGCNVDQSNRIINLTDNKCEIRPNLYIDEYDCNANHSALIGGFSKQELFYLQSRGLSINDANRLLINGFLLSDFDNVKMIKEIKNNINKYWG